MLQEAVLAALVQDFYSTVLERENQMRLMELVLIDDDARHRKARYWKDLAQQARSELAANAFGSVSFISAAMIKKHGLALKLDDLELRQVNQAMLRASCDLAEALGARFEGDFNFEPRDKLLKHVLADAEVTAPTRPDDISPPVQDEILFSVRAEEFRHLQLQRKVWEKQTALQARKTYQLFAEICGDRFLAGYVRSDSLQFRDTLIGLPANYGKAPEYRGRSAQDITAATSAMDLGRLAPRTVQRHLAALSSLWDSAKERGEVSENIFSGLKLPKGKKASEQRQMWSQDKLVQLFRTPIWRGCHSKDRRSKPGSIIIRDEKFWLPLIAVFSGLRQEEICQLISRTSGGNGASGSSISTTAHHVRSRTETQ